MLEEERGLQIDLYYRKLDLHTMCCHYSILMYATFGGAYTTIFIARLWSCTNAVVWNVHHLILASSNLILMAQLKQMVVRRNPVN